jgi:hypothetical protein
MLLNRRRALMDNLGLQRLVSAIHRHLLRGDCRTPEQAAGSFVGGGDGRALPNAYLFVAFSLSFVMARFSSVLNLSRVSTSAAAMLYLLESATRVHSLSEARCKLLASSASRLLVIAHRKECNRLIEVQSVRNGLPIRAEYRHRTSL